MTSEQRACLEGLVGARHVISKREAAAIRAALDEIDALAVTVAGYEQAAEDAEEAVAALFRGFGGRNPAEEED